jgi:hypothetical protein
MTTLAQRFFDRTIRPMGDDEIAEYTRNCRARNGHGPMAIPQVGKFLLPDGRLVWSVNRPVTPDLRPKASLLGSVYWTEQQTRLGQNWPGETQ